MHNDLGTLRQRHRIPVRLVFDTADHLVSKKARSIDRSRHLLFEVDELCLDLWLDRNARASQAVLSGQLAHRIDPLKPMTDIPVLLASGERVLATAASDRQGEFQMEYEPRDTMALFMPLGEDRLIEVPMT